MSDLSLCINSVLFGNGCDLFCKGDIFFQRSGGTIHHDGLKPIFNGSHQNLLVSGVIQMQICMDASGAQSLLNGAANDLLMQKWVIDMVNFHNDGGLLFLCGFQHRK